MRGFPPPPSPTWAYMPSYHTFIFCSFMYQIHRIMSFEKNYWKILEVCYFASFIFVIVCEILFATAKGSVVGMQCIPWYALHTIICRPELGNLPCHLKTEFWHLSGNLKSWWWTNNSIILPNQTVKLAHPTTENTTGAKYGFKQLVLITFNIRSSHPPLVTDFDNWLLEEWTTIYLAADIFSCHPNFYIVCPVHFPAG